MLIFILYTLIFWFAGNCILRIFHFAIQPEQALDMIFGWQRMLNNLYESNNKALNLLGKALGDCQMCMSFWFMILWYWAYFFTIRSLGLWPFDGILTNIIWYIAFHSIGTVAGLFILGIKLKKKRK